MIRSIRKIDEDLMDPSRNIAGDSRGVLFNNGPLHNKVVRVPYGVDEYRYLYMGHVHVYRIFPVGAFHQYSELFVNKQKAN